MLNNRLLKLFIILIISFFINGNAIAFYKPKMVVTEFDDPKNWNKPFSPGKAIANRLENELIKKNNFQIISSEKIQNMDQSKYLEPQIMGRPLPKMPKASKMNQGLKNMKNQRSMDIFLDKPRYRVAKNSQYQRSMEIDPAIHYYGGDSAFNLVQIQNPNNEIIDEQDRLPDESMDMANDSIPWPTNLAKVPQKGSLYKIIGKIIKFDPGAPDTSIDNSAKRDAFVSENAELEVKIQLVQNKTGRVVKEKFFKVFSKSGKRPFSKDIFLDLANGFNQKPSSMDLAIRSFTKEVFVFIKDTISSFYLEGEIIAINKEDILINVGRQNGVKIGDKFRVFSLGLNLADPLTGVDLGDIYSKRGIIRIVETMLGFSTAMIISGEKFLPGNLVKSFNKINNNFSDEIPWWEFRKNKRAK